MKNNINELNLYTCDAYYFLRVKLFITHTYTKHISESTKIMNYQQKNRVKHYKIVHLYTFK